MVMISSCLSEGEPCSKCGEEATLDYVWDSEGDSDDLASNPITFSYAYA